MKYLSLFTGIGGFEKGIEQAYENLSKTSRKEQGRISQNKSNNEFSRLASEQPTCIGYSEIDKYAIKIYEKHFGCITHTQQQEKGIGTAQGQHIQCTDECTNRFNNRPHTNYGDITKINPSELPDFDFLCGGFPCQSFSIAGKRGGFQDTRGTLFFDIARILQEKKPRLFLLENVKGLLSHDNGFTFKTIISTLTELGYDLQWQVLNSKNFGVPQNRERVFIVGHLRGTPRPKVFPFGKNGSTPDDLHRHVSNTLTARYEQAQATETYIGESERDAQKPTVIEDFFSDRVREFDGSPTLRSGRAGLKIKQEMKIRRLTPTECARLQGFPDDWHKVDGISDTQAYKCYGNAVTVNVIQAIIEKLITNP